MQAVLGVLCEESWAGLTGEGEIIYTSKKKKWFYWKENQGIGRIQEVGR